MKEEGAMRRAFVEFDEEGIKEAIKNELESDDYTVKEVEIKVSPADGPGSGPVITAIATVEK